MYLFLFIHFKFHIRVTFYKFVFLLSVIPFLGSRSVKHYLFHTHVFLSAAFSVVSLFFFLGAQCFLLALCLGHHSWSCSGNQTRGSCIQGKCLNPLTSSRALYSLLFSLIVYKLIQSCLTNT